MNIALSAGISLWSRVHRLLRTGMPARPPANAAARDRSPLSSATTPSQHQVSRRRTGVHAQSTPRTLRVVRVMEAGQHRSQVGRMVISGRMADVCAELDRLAACEATPG